MSVVKKSKIKKVTFGINTVPIGDTNDDGIGVGGSHANPTGLQRIKASKQKIFEKICSRRKSFQQLNLSSISLLLESKCNDNLNGDSNCASPVGSENTAITHESEKLELMQSVREHILKFGKQFKKFKVKVTKGSDTNHSQKLLKEYKDLFKDAIHEIENLEKGRGLGPYLSDATTLFKRPSHGTICTIPSVPEKSNNSIDAHSAVDRDEYDYQYSAYRRYSFIEQCDYAINECPNIARIKRRLKDYQMNRDYYRNVVHIKTNTVPDDIINYLNDFDHILTKHNTNDPKEFREIHKFVDISCKADSCKILKRNQRIRGDKVDMEIDDLCGDNQKIVFVDLIDNMHAFVVHSYDLNHRTRIVEEKCDSDEHKSNFKFVRKISIKSSKSSKCENIKTSFTNTLSRKMQANPFQQRRNKYQVHRRRKDNKSVTVSDNTEYGEFCFGQRFYYWKYGHSGKRQQYSVHTKHKDLKEEACSHRITAKKWKQINVKANFKLKTNVAKETQSTFNASFDKYGISPGTPLSLKNLIVLILYCDFDKFSTDFSKSFFKIHHKDTIDSVKKRNSEYFWTSKTLRETVECYGISMEESKIKTFYHGISYMTFPSFIGRFNAPLSTSTDIAVAKTFAGNDGIIMELAQYGPKLKFFNCSWISNYSTEQERLFFGGVDTLRFQSIYDMRQSNPNDQDLRYYVKALSHLHAVLRGEHLDRDVNALTQNDLKIVNAIIDNHLGHKKNAISQYIQHTFRTFCKYKNTIKIHLHNLRSYSVKKTDELSFASLLLSKQHPNLLNLWYLCKIFPKCTRIEIEYRSDGREFCDIPENYKLMPKLLIELGDINKESDLKCVKLRGIKFMNERLGDWTQNFREKGWIVKMSSYKTEWKTFTDCITLTIIKKGYVQRKNSAEYTYTDQTLSRDRSLRFTH